MAGPALTGGLRDAPIDAARIFRAALNAMARPGTIETIGGVTPPGPLSPAAGALLLTLADGDTPLYLAADHDTGAVRDWLTFHCGARFAPPDSALFAIGGWGALLPLDPYPAGTPAYPDRSATLIVECDRIAAKGAVLTGPGIRDQTRLSLPDPAAFRRNRALFPCGLDFFLTAGTRLAALPRTTTVEAA